LIKEGLLNNKTKPVVIGKGKEVIREDDFISPKNSKIASSFKNVMENLYLEASTSAGIKIYSNKCFKSVSLRTSPILCKIVDPAPIEVNKLDENKVNEEFPLFVIGNVDQQEKI